MWQVIVTCVQNEEERERKEKLSTQTLYTGFVSPTISLLVEVLLIDIIVYGRWPRQVSWSEIRKIDGEKRFKRMIKKESL